MNVTLIGMGSGQPESLTLQSLAALRQADLILGARRLLAALPAGCTANRAAAYRADEVAELLHTSGAENAVLVYSGDTGFYSGAAALLDDRPRYRVAGHTDAHSIQSGAALIRHLRPARHDDGQRPGAEGCHQQLGALRHLADKTRQHLWPGDVDDKGVILRAPLGHKDSAHRRAVAGIGGNAVDRLSGQGYKLSLPQQLRGLGYACFIGRQNSGFDFHTNHRSFYL